jgi:tripartite-type tricarboxylate transporter receptor subunit TctC
LAASALLNPVHAQSQPASASPASANPAPQAFPTRALKIILPFAAGTATDAQARVLGQHLSEAFKQTVVVENKTGANGILGVDAVIKAAADGHTLFFTTNTTQAANPSLLKVLPYNPETDLAPVSLFGHGSFMLAVRVDAPFTTLPQLIALGKANPGKLSYATSSASGVVSGAMLGSSAGLDWVHVPYKSGPAAINDVLGGQVTGVFVDLVAALPHLRAGKLKGIALTSAKGQALFPDLPTMSTVPGMADFDLTYWTAAYVAANTPPDIIATLNQEIARFAARKDVIDRYGPMGFAVTSSTPTELAKFQSSEIVKWRGMIRAAKIAPE